MKIWDIVFRVITLVIGVILIAFNVLLYNFCEGQKTALNSMRDKQDVESEFNSNKFKFQEEQIERLRNDLDQARQQIKDQKDTLADQENENRSIQTSLVDIKAEADAIKQDMKAWQKDYVSVLAQLEKKMDDSQDEIKSFGNSMTALNIPELKENINSLKTDIEKINHPPDNSLSAALPGPDKNDDHTQSQSQ